MGKITPSYTTFKSAEFLYSKIKRELKSFGAVGLIDDTDFPLYTAQVLKKLGQGALKEETAVLRIHNGKCHLPDDFISLYAAYKCGGCNVTTQGLRHYQGSNVYEHDITCDVLCRKNKCEINCECPDQIINRVVVKHYVNEQCTDTYKYNNVSLLRLSPNVKEHCTSDCLNINVSNANEITINDRCIYTNFTDGDVFLQYYAFPTDDDGLPQIPDIHHIENCIEWYIKYQIMLTLWFNDDVKDIQNKWGVAKQLYDEAFAEAKYITKLPSFALLANQVRMARSINKTAFFAQTDRFH